MLGGVGLGGLGLTSKSNRVLRSVVGVGRDLSYQIVALPHAP